MERYDINPDWAHSGIMKAGDFAFTSYCIGDMNSEIQTQINGAFDHLEYRLSLVGMSLDNVVKIDALFRDIQDIPYMEKVIKARFNGKYPARKSLQTVFPEENQLFQLDAVAYQKAVTCQTHGNSVK